MRGCANDPSGMDAVPSDTGTTVLSQTSAQNARSTPNASQSVRFVKPIFRPTRRQPVASRRRPIAASTA